MAYRNQTHKTRKSSFKASHPIGRSWSNKAPMQASDNEPATPRIVAGDIVVFNGIEQSVVSGSLKIGYIEKSWDPKMNGEIIATYAGQTRMSLIDVPDCLVPTGLYAHGLRRKSMTLVMMHTFMTQAGSIIIANPNDCEKIV